MKLLLALASITTALYFSAVAGSSVMAPIAHALSSVDTTQANETHYVKGR